MWNRSGRLRFFSRYKLAKTLNRAREIIADVTMPMPKGIKGNNKIRVVVVKNAIKNKNSNSR